MLVQTFFTPVPAIQQYKNLHLDQKEMYSTKLKMFFFHSSKIEGMGGGGASVRDLKVRNFR